MTLHDAHPKTALRRGLLSEPFTNALYACAPYRGCGHACAYCDGRAEKYYVEGDFASDIIARRNLPDLLDIELGRLRERDSHQRRPLLSMGSGVTDSYQPAEAQLELSRRSAEVLLAHRQPAVILTKSALIRRDLDLWAELHRQAGCVLFMTITTTDETVRQHFEPGASSLIERFATLEAFKAVGIPTGILAMPLLPGICDSQSSLEALFARAGQAGVDFLMAGGLTLRPGRQKDHYLSVLQSFAPGLEGLYREAYAEERPSGAPMASVSRALQERVAPIQSASGLPWFLPHAVLRRILPEYEALHLLFCQMVEAYRAHRIDTRPLQTAARRYTDWLQEVRRGFNRQRSLPSDWIERQFLACLASSAWEELLGNTKLAAFSREIALRGRDWDWRSLRLLPGNAAEFY